MWRCMALVLSTLFFVSPGRAFAYQDDGDDTEWSFEEMNHAPSGGVTSGNGAPGPPPPSKTFVYTNDMGAFEIDSQGGTGKYKWFDGSSNSDTLKFVTQGVLTSDNRSHVVYVYEATNGTNTWWLAFGVKSGGKIHGKEWYPLFYSFEVPANSKFHRWRTPSWTGRIEI